MFSELCTCVAAPQKKFLMSGVTSFTHSLTWRSGRSNVEVDTSAERRYNISCSWEFKTQVFVQLRRLTHSFIIMSGCGLWKIKSRPPAAGSAAPHSPLLWQSGPPGHGEPSGNRN